MRWWKKQLPQDEDASLTMDPMVAYGAWAGQRASAKDDEAAPSAAILLLLLCVPAVFVIAGVVALLLR